MNSKLLILAYARGAAMRLLAGKGVRARVSRSFVRASVPAEGEVARTPQRRPAAQGRVSAWPIVPRWRFAQCSGRENGNKNSVLARTSFLRYRGRLAPALLGGRSRN